jgi:thioredoxin-related protein
MPSSVDDDRQYLREKGIEIADVVQASGLALGVNGTPTLLLVDNAGKVLEQWNGKLPATEADKVLSRLKQ